VTASEPTGSGAATVRGTPPDATDGTFRRSDLIVLAALIVVAAVLRLPGLASRGGWDADQGRDMLILWRLVNDHLVPLVGPPTSIGDLHHGALYYLILAPFAWISGSDPVVVMTAIAVGGVIAVAVTWWLARSIGGPVAGLVAGLLMAVSASAINESISIWNPNLIALSASIALAAAWQAHRTGRARWWVVAAAGLVVTMQCHVLGVTLAPPLLVRYLLDVRSAPPGPARARLGRAGLAAIGVGIVGYLPLIVHELGNDFSETRSALAFLAGGGGSIALSLPARLLFVGLRILAWPLDGLLTDRLALGVILGIALVAGFTWRARSAPEPERSAVRFLGGTLLFAWLVLGAGIGALATVTPLPVDHYHAFLDPIVFVGAGLAVAGLWRLAGQAAGRPLAARPGPGLAARAAIGLATAALVAFNLSIAPPAPSPDGGWAAAELASERILMATAGRPIELRSLPAFKAADAYGFPLTVLHAVVTGTLQAPTAWTVAAAASSSGTGAVAGDVGPPALASSSAIVTICDALFIHDCGGRAEAAAVPASGFRQVDRFSAAPGRTITVYVPGP